MFDAYTRAKTKEWREDVNPNTGTYYIDYICLLDAKAIPATAQKEGVVERWVDIKFIVQVFVYVIQRTKTTSYNYKPRIISKERLKCLYYSYRPKIIGINKIFSS